MSRAAFIMVYEQLVDDLSTDELAMWLVAKRHERDGLTLAQLAERLHWPMEHARIRAERIRERGYVLAVRDESEEAA